jgi:dephospho-CoA kinase
MQRITPKKRKSKNQRNQKMKTQMKKIKRRKLKNLAISNQLPLNLLYKKLTKLLKRKKSLED